MSHKKDAGVNCPDTQLKSQISRAYYAHGCTLYEGGLLTACLYDSLIVKRCKKGRFRGIALSVSPTHMWFYNNEASGKN